MALLYQHSRDVRVLRLSCMDFLWRYVPMGSKRTSAGTPKSSKSLDIITIHYVYRWCLRDPPILRNPQFKIHATYNRSLAILLDANLRFAWDMSVYLRHSLFWDVWDCYGKLMSEPQKSSMDWCSDNYIYIYSIFHHVSPCFKLFFFPWKSIWVTCLQLPQGFLRLPEVEPALVMSSSQVAWKRNRHWRSDGKIWRMTRLSKKMGWMTDDGWWRMNDGWWWMNDGWWMYPSMMVFVCLHFRQSSLHKVPPFWGPKPRCCAGIWRLPLLQRQPNGRERCP